PLWRREPGKARAQASLAHCGPRRRVFPATAYTVTGRKTTLAIGGLGMAKKGENQKRKVKAKRPMVDSYVRVIDELKAARESRGWTDRSLAGKAGIGPDELCKLWGRKYKLNALGLIEAVAEALGMRLVFEVKPAPGRESAPAH